MRKSMLVVALVALVVASSVMAGWKTEQFMVGSDSIYYQVHTKLGQDFFTIAKSVSSYRVYITFEGVGYEQFKSSVVNWKAATKPGNNDDGTGASNNAGAMSAVTLTDATIGDANGNISFGVFLADKFSTDGRIPKLSVVVMPNPAFNAHSGGSPNVTVQANNCDVAGVKVIYAPRPVDASGSQQAPSGQVAVNTGTIDSSVSTFSGRNYGNVGTIHVQGGLFGNCSIRGNVGTLFSEGRICTIKPGGSKQKVIQGGSLGGVLITAGGNIGTISARNGLFGAGGDSDKNRIVSGYAATPKLYSASANVGQIVVKRGWDKPCVVAGSDATAKYSSTAPTFYNGGIKMFRVNNKGDGTYTSQTGGAFTSAVAPRVTGKMKSSVSGNTIFVQRWGKCDLNDFVK
ncbi:hypothetical protein IJS98_00270 [bacterium]|nr:hypothetical protein [bacterium]